MLTEKEKNELRKVIDKGGPEAASAASALFDYYLASKNKKEACVCFIIAQRLGEQAFFMDRLSFDDAWGSLSQANRERCSELAAAKAPLAAVEN